MNKLKQLSTYEEVKLAVLVMRKIEKIEKNIKETKLDWFSDILKNDLQEWQTILNKLK